MRSQDADIERECRELGTWGAQISAWESYSPIQCQEKKQCDERWEWGRSPSHQAAEAGGLPFEAHRDNCSRPCLAVKRNEGVTLAEPLLRMCGLWVPSPARGACPQMDDSMDGTGQDRGLRIRWVGWRGRRWTAWSSSWGLTTHRWARGAAQETQEMEVQPAPQELQTSCPPGA